MLSKMALSLALMLTLATPAQAAGATTTGSIIRPGTSSESFLFSNPQRTYRTAGAQIFLDGSPASFAQLQLGDTATLTLNDDSSGLARIDAHTEPVRQFSGTLSDVSRYHRHVSAPLGDGSTRVFWVDTASTQVTINGASASMGELAAGDHVDISYRTTTALSIAATRQAAADTQAR